ncbi:MAG: hypothetical protein Q9218_000477 [Villophora microphyllina]
MAALVDLRGKYLSDQVRTLMRELSHPLTVIVAQSKDCPRPATLLVSSFNCVTLDPVPHVSFNVKVPSSTYDEINKSTTFTASAITNIQLARHLVMDKTDPRYIDVLRTHVHNDGAGKLVQEKGGIWWMRCQLLEDKCVDVGDHVVVIGKVMSAGFYKARNKHGKVLDKALIYGQRFYRYAGPPIMLPSMPQRKHFTADEMAKNLDPELEH